MLDDLLAPLGLPPYLVYAANVVLSVFLVIVPLLLSVAYLTLLERKVIAAMQLRKGPNVVGPLGLLQPLADGLKLFLKEVILPARADKALFLLAPMITFVLALIGWAVIPVTRDFVIADLNVGVLYLLATSSLGVYGVIISGWASNSKYAFLGAVRSAAQMISYEVAIGFAIICVLLVTGSLNLREIVQYDKSFTEEVLLFPMLVVFFVSALAETNRHPFDLPEAEAELVAGYNVEYSSMTFALFFLGEYANMILMSAVTTILFLGGWYAPFGLGFLHLPDIVWFVAKVMAALFLFIWVRAALPRYRYDQLMRLGWKVFLPLTLVWVVVVSTYVAFAQE
ncbi:MAG: NADH-quinone oxidoreductase subunit NuoH [Rickettsiales bacterium]